MAFLEIDNLTKKFGDLTAVNDVSLSVEEGSFVTIVGPSGCGKTTVLRTISGLEQPTSGDIRLGGESITTLPPYRRNIGLVFQDYALFPHKTVAENIAFGLKMRGASSDEQRSVVEEMLEIVNLEGYEGKYPDECSGGEQQRIAVARALAFDPDLVLMDEPLSNLDKNLRNTVRNELREIQAETGVTTVYVTHNQNEALSLGDKLAVLNNGRLEQYEAPENVYQNPGSEFVADFLGRATRVFGTVEFDDGTPVAVLENQGRVQLPDDVALDTGDDIALFLRDEKLQLYPAPTGGPNDFLGEVVDIDYRGRDVNYFIRVKKLNETLQVSHIPGEGDIQFYDEGDEVYISIDPEALTYVQSSGVAGA